MNRKTKFTALKYLCYGLIILLLYVLQTTPGFLMFFGVKLHLIVPWVVCLAIFEGEFIGGLFGAYGGVLCDMASYTLFGFFSVQLLVLCVLVGLAAIYLVKNNRQSAVLLTGGVLLWLGLTQYFFYYGMWAYDYAWMIFVYDIVPAIVFSLPVALLFYVLEGRLFAFFEGKMEE